MYKSKVKGVLSVALTVMLLASLMIGAAAVPAGANPGINVWDRQALPAEGAAGNYALLDGAPVMGVMDQAIDGTLYAYDSQGPVAKDLFKSTDGGYTWSLTGYNPAAAGCNAIVCSPSEANVIYVADGAAPGNIFKSADSGATFSTLATAAAGTILSLDVVKRGADYMVLAGTGGAANTNIADVFLLDESDAFPSLTSMGFLAHFAACDQVVAVAFAPDFATSRQVVAVGSEDTADTTQISTKLGGAAWGGTIGDPALIASDALFGAIAFPTGYSSSTASGNCNWYVGINDPTAATEGVYLVQGVSPGASIATRVRTAEVKSLQVTGPAGAAMILAGDTAQTVHYSANSGVTWDARIKQPTGTGNVAVVMDKDFVSNGKAWASIGAAEGGISLSGDSAHSWNQVGLVATDFAAINDLSLNGDVIFMGTTETGGTDSIWKFDGTNWERVFHSSIYAVADQVEVSPDFATTNAVFAADTAATAIYRSMDGGLRWAPQITAVGGNVTTMAVMDSAHLITGDSTTAGNVNITINNGLSWTAVVTGSGSNIVSMVLAPGYAHPGTILAGCANGQVRRSTNGGATWTLQGAVIAANDAFVAFDPNYATNSTIYHTLDTAGTVQRFVCGTSTAWTQIDVTTAGTYTVIDGSGIVVSDDGDGNSTVYVADQGANDGLARSVNPTSSMAPTARVFFDQANDTAVGVLAAAETMTGIWLTPGSNKIWCVDTTNDRIYHYTDALATAVTGVKVSAPGQTTAKASWDALSGALTYAAICDDDARCTADIAAVAHVYDNLDQEDDLTGLTAGSTYYFKVRVATPVRSRYSDVSSFSTGLAVMSISTDFFAPVLGAQDVQLRPAFAWAVVAGASKYEFELSKDPRTTARGYFVEVVTSATGDNALIETVWLCDRDLDYSTTYFWHVKATSATSKGAWATGTFTTEAAPPAPEPPPPPPPPTPEPTTPAYIWAVIGIGAALCIAVVVLIVRTRRVA